jgi:hypothetical protein
MTAVDEIAEKAARLDSGHLKLLRDYADLLLTDQLRRTSGAEIVERPIAPTLRGSPFARTTLETPDAPSVYQGPALSLEQMREAVDWEAAERP